MSRLCGGAYVASLPSIQISPGIRLDEARYRHQHGRLARAGRAEQRQKLTLLEIEARTGKSDDAAISLSEIYGLEFRLVHGARAILRLVR